MGDNNFERKLPLLSGKGMWHTNDCGGLYPQLHLSDGPHGLRKQDEGTKSINDSYVSTCYPTASCLAASWDRELIFKVADSLGKEAWNADVSILLGPGVNIKRSPLCGRNFEYYSEDPYLAGEIGASFIKGVQQNGVGTSLKHFAGNSQETRRMTSNSRIDERTLREIYLSAFENCVKNAKPATVMVSYNYLNGYKATENKHLLTDILRNDWKYEGVTVSDWGACIDISKSVKAGLDLEMPSSGKAHLKKVKKDLKAGRITEEDLHTAVGRLEKLIDSYALENRKDHAKKATDAHKIALEAALGGAVLLKNENNILPLKGTKEINLIGELARTVRFQGSGSSHINTSPRANIIEEFEKAGFKVNFVPGYKIDSAKVDEELLKEAIELVKNGLPTIICGGLTDLAEGEGYDRKSFDIPENQIRLFEKIDRGDLIFLSFGGSPFSVPFLDKIKAMLHMYLGGEAVAEASVKLITGEINPSGRLAETWPLSISDTPAYGYFAAESNEIYYMEGLLVGYRHYDTKGIETRFPFGFGLSYTSFEYSDLTLSSAEYDGGEIKISFKVKNIGSVPGAEVAQIYVENPYDGFARAKHELRGFEKIFLNPGEEKSVEITLEERAFSIFDTNLNRFNVSGGEYRICVGKDIDHLILSEKLIVKGKDYVKESAGTGLDVFVGNTSSDLDNIKPGEYSVYHSLGELSKKSFLAKKLMDTAIKKAHSMYKGMPDDSPEVMMTVETIKDGPIDCIILQSGVLPYGIAEMIVKQANRKK